MRYIICILFSVTFKYASQLQIELIPDTIYVGSLTTITIYVNDLGVDEYPIFPNIIEQPDIYTVVERKLNDYSVDYILQFWSSGIISIPNLIVSIKKDKKNLMKLESQIIKIPVLSNINENNSALRDIKPMFNLAIIDTYKLLLYILLFITGSLLAMKLWKSRKINKKYDHMEGSYEKSIFEQTISNLELLNLPKNINLHTTEEYYLSLSRICRTFIKKKYYIRATEMTSKEIEIYFQSIGIHQNLIITLTQTNNIADLAKYAGQLPTIEQFINDKENFINIIKLFQRKELKQQV